MLVRANKGFPMRVRDVGDVTIGHAPRLGEFGYQKNDDAVEGVILMLRGEQTQNVLKGVEEKTDKRNPKTPPPAESGSLPLFFPGPVTRPFPAYLRAQRTLRQTFPPDGRNYVVRARRRSHPDPHFNTGARLILVQKRRQRETKSRL